MPVCAQQTSFSVWKTAFPVLIKQFYYNQGWIYNYVGYIEKQGGQLFKTKNGIHTHFDNLQKLNMSLVVQADVVQTESHKFYILMKSAFNLIAARIHVWAML